MLYDKNRYQNRRGSNKPAVQSQEESVYEPQLAFLLDDKNEVSRMNDQVAYIVDADAKGEVQFTVNGMAFGKVNVDGKRMMTVEDVADAVADVVGKANVTSKFLSNGQKLVRNGNKVAKGVDQLCLTINNTIWIDVVLVEGGPNAPTDMTPRFGNLFFFVRTRLNGFDINGEVTTEWQPFLDSVKAQFNALKV